MMSERVVSVGEVLTIQASRTVIEGEIAIVLHDDVSADLDLDDIRSRLGAFADSDDRAADVSEREVRELLVELDAQADELRIANERGDGWREQVKEDTHRIEQLEAALTELVDAQIAAAMAVDDDSKERWHELTERNDAALDQARAVLAGGKQT